MKLLFLIPAIVSGFLYCHFYKREYYKLHRYQGQYLYLRSIAYGLFFLLVEVTLSLLLHKLVPEHIHLFFFTLPLDLLNGLSALLTPIYHDGAKETAFLLQTSIFVLILARFSAHLQNKRMKKGYGEDLKLLYLYDVQDSPSDKLIVNAFIDRHPLLFTLISGKVYVGEVLEIPLPNESEKQNEEIKILPIMSGYRTLEHTIRFNTDYDLSKVPEELKNIELAITLSKKDLISISHFEFDLHTHLTRHHS